MITAFFGLIMVIYTVYTWELYGAPNGYATIVVLISFMFSVLFVIVGIIGEYIAILFAEIKDRPVYIVRDTANFGKNENRIRLDRTFSEKRRFSRPDRRKSPGNTGKTLQNHE